MAELPEVVMYALATLVGVAAGIAFAGLAVAAFRWLGYVSGLLTTVVVVVIAFAVADHAPWIGPVYAIVAGITTLLVSASLQSDEPGLLGESYWHRVVLLAFHRRRLTSAQASAAQSTGTYN